VPQVVLGQKYGSALSPRTISLERGGHGLPYFLLKLIIAALPSPFPHCLGMWSLAFLGREEKFFFRSPSFSFRPSLVLFLVFLTAAETSLNWLLFYFACLLGSSPKKEGYGFHPFWHHLLAKLFLFPSIYFSFPTISLIFEDFQMYYICPSV